MWGMSLRFWRGCTNPKRKRGVSFIPSVTIPRKPRPTLTLTTTTTTTMATTPTATMTMTTRLGLAHASVSFIGCMST